MWLCGNTELGMGSELAEVRGMRTPLYLWQLRELHRGLWLVDACGSVDSDQDLHEKKANLMLALHLWFRHLHHQWKIFSGLQIRKIKAHPGAGCLIALANPYSALLLALCKVFLKQSPFLMKERICVCGKTIWKHLVCMQGVDKSVDSLSLSKTHL